MQLRELIILLLLILLVAVVIAFVVRRGNVKRNEEHGAEAAQMGTQAAWLESADESAEAAADVAPAAVPAVPEEISDDGPNPVEPEEENVEVPMTRAERREARDAAETAQAAADDAAAAGPAWAGAVADSDPDAQRIAAAAGFRDEVPASEALSEDIAIPTNEWGGPREGALDEEPTVENPVEDDLIPDEPEVLAEGVAVAEEPTPEVVPAQAGRRISGFLELRDGGFGVGSAAPIEDGAQPLDHPVQAYRDSMTFREPGDAGYDSAEPDVWFYDAGAAERSGFLPSDG